MIDLRHGDCLDVMRTLADSFVDSVVTDPPYHLTNNGGGPHNKTPNAYSRAQAGAGSGGFMGKAWDGGDIAFQPATWIEAMRVLKPGGYLLAFGGTRTYHRMACAIEDAGFEIRDQIGWTYGSGFPKSHNGPWGGTALTPAWEPICVARKPLIGTVEQNWREHGTGALNIDGCRVEAEAGGRPLREVTALRDDVQYSGNALEGRVDGSLGSSKAVGATDLGRWPANLIHDGSDEVVALFPREAGAAAPVTVRNGDKFRAAYGAFKGDRDEGGSTFQGDTGSAARFFYCAKADMADRDDGLEGMPKVHRPNGNKWTDQDYRVTTGERPASSESGPRGNTHPTVKPTDLMRYLCRLVTPAGGLILDPFMGSGSTGRGAVLEGFRFIGIEREAEYLEIARARIDSARRQGHQPSLDLEAA